MGLIVASVWQRFDQIIQREKTRGARDYGIAEQSGHQSTELCYFG